MRRRPEARGSAGGRFPWLSLGFPRLIPRLAVRSAALPCFREVPPAAPPSRRALRLALRLWPWVGLGGGKDRLGVKQNKVNRRLLLSFPSFPMVSHLTPRGAVCAGSTAGAERTLSPQPDPQPDPQAAVAGRSSLTPRLGPWLLLLALQGCPAGSQPRTDPTPALSKASPASPSRILLPCRWAPLIVTPLALWCAHSPQGSVLSPPSVGIV